jgi:hypothetical protein
MFLVHGILSNLLPPGDIFPAIYCFAQKYRIYRKICDELQIFATRVLTLH